MSAEFQRIARYEDQQSRIYNKGGKLLFADDSNQGDRPEVDRGQLRQMLLDSLPDGTLQWDHESIAIHPRDGGIFELAFRNGLSTNCDPVVGADGAWSRIRPLVYSVRPPFLDVMFVDLGIADVDQRHPRSQAWLATA